MGLRRRQRHTQRQRRAQSHRDVTIEWNGCNQAYPGAGAISCYGQSDGGYGDGIGTPAGTCLTAHVDHSTFRYNTQDGYDMLHNDKGNCSMSITNSTSYGNNGAQFKWGPNDNPMVFTNNTVIANCTRLSAPFPGTAQRPTTPICEISAAPAMRSPSDSATAVLS